MIDSLAKCFFVLSEGEDIQYCRTMVLTSRINIAIGIDTLRHAKFYENLFDAMKFQHTELTCSGLRRMWRKKEYGCIYFGLQKVKLRQRIKQSGNMVEGTKKLEEDAWVVPKCSRLLLSRLLEMSLTMRTDLFLPNNADQKLSALEIKHNTSKFKHDILLLSRTQIKIIVKSSPCYSRIQHDRHHF
jgi:hypothetical protein